MTASTAALKTCALDGCEKQFKPYRPSSRFCCGEHSVRHRNDARGHRQFEPKKCIGCGIKFVPKKTTQVYHSTGCHENFRGDARLVKRLRRLDAILREKGIDLDELESSTVKSVKFWQQGYKDASGEGVVQDLAGITFSPKWETGPDWPVVQPGPVVKLVKPPKAVPLLGTWRRAVLLPDIQGGFWREPVDGKLVPTHDVAALEVALAITRDVKPHHVVMHGDNLDLPEFGKYRKSPVFAQTTQATVDWGSTFLARLADVSPNAERTWIAGNHEERLPNYIIDNAVAAFALKRAGDNWPVLSVPNLLRFEESGTTFIPGYPASEMWLNDNLRVIHGSHVNSRGSSGGRYLEDERVSVLYGHVHRRELIERTRHTRNGPRTILAASFGCLCRIDGAVPSTKGGHDLDGRPTNTTEDWQQGLGVVHYEPGGKHRFAIESIAIWNGWANFGGVEYVGRPEVLRKR